MGQKNGIKNKVYAHSNWEPKMVNSGYLIKNIVQLNGTQNNT